MMVGRMLEGARKENNATEPFGYEFCAIRQRTIPAKPERRDDALAFAEALLEHIYVLRTKIEEFTRRGTGQG